MLIKFSPQIMNNIQFYEVRNFINAGVTGDPLKEMVHLCNKRFSCTVHWWKMDLHWWPSFKHKRASQLNFAFHWSNTFLQDGCHNIWNKPCKGQETEVLKDHMEASYKFVEIPSKRRKRSFEPKQNVKVLVSGSNFYEVLNFDDSSTSQAKSN